MRYQILFCLLASILLLSSCAKNSNAPEKPAGNQTAAAPAPPAAPAPAPPDTSKPLPPLFDELEGWMGRVHHNRAKDNRFIYMSLFLPVEETRREEDMMRGIAKGTPFTILSSGRKLAVKYDEYYNPTPNSSGAMEVLFIMDDNGSAPKEDEIVWVLPAQATAEAESIKLEQLPKKDSDRREWQAGPLSFYYQRSAAYQADLFLAGIGAEPIVIDKFETSKEELEELYEYSEGADTSSVDLYKNNVGFQMPVAAFKPKKTGPTVVIFNFLGMECSNYKPVLIDGQNRKELGQIYTCAY